MPTLLASLEESYPIGPRPAGHDKAHTDVNKLVNQLAIGTGWRNVSSLLTDGWTVTAIQIKRNGDEVTVRFRGLAPSGSVPTPPLAFLRSTGMAALFFGTASRHPIQVGGGTWQPFLVDGDGVKAPTASTTTPNLEFQYIRWSIVGASPTTTLPGIAT